MFLVDAGNSPLVRPCAIDLTRGIANSLSFYRFEKSYASDLFRCINVCVLYSLSIGYTYISSFCFLLSPFFIRVILFLLFQLVQVSTLNEIRVFAKEISSGALQSGSSVRWREREREKFSYSI